MLYNIDKIHKNFEDKLKPLLENNWKYTKLRHINIINDDIHIISIHKKFNELEEISIYVNKNDYSCKISLPIKKSTFNYLKKFTDINLSYSFLDNYVSYLIIN